MLNEFHAGTTQDKERHISTEIHTSRNTDNDQTQTLQASLTSRTLQRSTTSFGFSGSAACSPNTWQETNLSSIQRRPVSVFALLRSHRTNIQFHLTLMQLSRPSCDQSLVFNKEGDGEVENVVYLFTNVPQSIRHDPLLQ